MSQMIESFLQPAGADALRARPVEFQEPATLPDGPALLTELNPLHSLKVTLQVRVGQSSMTVGELLDARENEVLVLDRAVEQPVELLLQGSVVARGQLVAVDGSFGVRITELPVSLKF
jgi:flagellar motor switch protein FliN/FliY